RFVRWETRAAGPPPREWRARRRPARRGGSEGRGPQLSSRALRLRQSRQEIARGVLLLIADNGCSATVRLHNRPFGHRLNGVIGAFAVDIRFEKSQQPTCIR